MLNEDEVGRINIISFIDRKRSVVVYFSKSLMALISNRDIVFDIRNLRFRESTIFDNDTITIKEYPVNNKNQICLMVKDEDDIPGITGKYSVSKNGDYFDLERRIGI